VGAEPGGALGSGAGGQRLPAFCGQAGYVAPGSFLPAIQGGRSVQTPHKAEVTRSAEALSIPLPHRTVSSDRFLRLRSSP
jgi:hypothetical protein